MKHWISAIGLSVALSVLSAAKASASEIQTVRILPELSGAFESYLKEAGVGYSEVSGGDVVLATSTDEISAVKLLVGFEEYLTGFHRTSGNNWDRTPEEHIFEARQVPRAKDTYYIHKDAVLYCCDLGNNRFEFAEMLYGQDFLINLASRLSGVIRSDYSSYLCSKCDVDVYSKGRQIHIEFRGNSRDFERFEAVLEIGTGRSATDSVLNELEVYSVAAAYLRQNLVLHRVPKLKD